MAQDYKEALRQRLFREREMVREAEARRAAEQQAEAEAELQKKIKIAEDMGLSEEEKSRYLAKDSVLEEAPTTGIGPVKSANKYASLLEAISTKPKEESIITAQAEVPKLTEATDSAETKLKAKQQLSTSPTSAAGGKANNLADVIAGKGAAPEGTTSVTEQAPAVAKLSAEDTLMERLKRAEETKKEERQRTDIGQLASMVGRSLAQIGAAQAGMKSGVDMSGVAQKELVDWEARRKQINDDYATELAGISKEREQLLAREKEARDAENDRQMLAIRKQELRNEQRKTDAFITKQEEEIKIARAAAGKPDNKQVEAIREKEAANFDKLNEKQAKVVTANAEINSALDEADKLTTAGNSIAAGFADRTAITAYLKQLDPESAVLAAEYSAAKDINKLTPLLESKFKDLPDKLVVYLKAGMTGTMQPDTRALLRQSANTNFQARDNIYKQEVGRVLKRAQKLGVPDPVMVMGRAPRDGELDEETAAAWGLDVKPRQSSATTPPKKETAEAAPTGPKGLNITGKYKTAEEALAALGGK